MGQDEQLALGLAVIGAVVGEWVVSEARLGHFILQSNAADREGLRAIGPPIMGVGLFLSVAVLQRLAILWHYQATGPGGA